MRPCSSQDLWLHSYISDVNTIEVVVSLQKERDLELAAHIGQSLLKKNKALSERNELLEEQVEHIREEVHKQRVSLVAVEWDVWENDLCILFKQDWIDLEFSCLSVSHCTSTCRYPSFVTTCPWKMSCYSSTPVLLRKARWRLLPLHRMSTFLPSLFITFPSLQLSWHNTIPKLWITSSSIRGDTKLMQLSF